MTIQLCHSSLLSLKSMKKHGEMSLRKDKTVSQIVEKYMRQYSSLDRDLVRKLIRLENPNLNLRTVDRHLKKAYEQKAFSQHNETITTEKWKDYVDGNPFLGLKRTAKLRRLIFGKETTKKEGKS